MGTPKGPFMGDDLVSCSKTKPAEEEDAGLGWAGIEPPLPAESCPKPDAACKAAAKACDADGSCKKAKAKGGTKGIVDGLPRWQEGPQRVLRLELRMLRP